MRCRLILLISEHPIQQGIRKGGGPHFCDEDEDEEEWRILGSWMLPMMNSTDRQGEQLMSMHSRVIV